MPITRGILAIVRGAMVANVAVAAVAVLHAEIAMIAALVATGLPVRVDVTTSAGRGAMVRRKAAGAMTGAGAIVAGAVVLLDNSRTGIVSQHRQWCGRRR